MKIVRDEILRLSGLSGLSFNEDEVVEITEYLENMIEQMSSFIDLDTSFFENVADETYDILRDDIVISPFDRKAILLNAPDSDGEMFIVPRVVE